MVKNFVLDTNVLLHDPRAIFKFQDNIVNIPIFVIEEIDKFKREVNELGRNAREVSRILDSFRESGSLQEGVAIESGGQLRVLLKGSEQAAKTFLSLQLKDNQILGVALEIQSKEPERECIFVTKDVNLRVRADVLGLQARNYEDDAVYVSELYTGCSELLVTDDLINEFHESESLTLTCEQLLAFREVNTSQSTQASPPKSLRANQYLLLRSNSGTNQTSLARVDSNLTIQSDSKEGLKNQQGSIKITHVKRSGRDETWGIRPRNMEQAFALDALLDDSIELVTLVGKAGTGKTLLAIAAGLSKVTEEHSYSKLVVSRPVVPMGNDVGYLPGTLEEKLNPWMRPIFDNVEFLLGLSKQDRRMGRGADELLELGIMEIEPLTYIRGRSLPNQYMIVDEAQNLTPHEVKTILTRCGEGTKIVLTGDPYQIDNPYIDSQSNGLSYVVSRFAGQPLAATVSLTKGERSELAEVAANIL